jgi:hypothetical protein
MEYRVALRSIEAHDFSEGIRAVLVDKDNTPKWSPDCPTNVKWTTVSGYFVPFDSEADELDLSALDAAVEM